MLSLAYSNDPDVAESGFSNEVVSTVPASAEGGIPGLDSDFTITPGNHGSWFNSSRDGEGFLLEVTETPTERILVVYWFTYDLLGNQMWLVGAGPIHGTVADVPVIVTNGPQFGEGFSPDDVIREAIGTLTFTFNDCQTGLVNYDINGFGIGQITIERLTQISGLGCN